jgi:hypothetical protein
MKAISYRITLKISTVTLPQVEGLLDKQVIITILLTEQ